LGGEAGKKTGGDTGDEQEWQIGKDGFSDDGTGDGDLADIMGDRGKGADQPEAFFLKKRQEEDIGQKGKASSCEAIEHGREA